MKNRIRHYLLQLRKMPLPMQTSFILRLIKLKAQSPVHRLRHILGLHRRLHALPALASLNLIDTEGEEFGQEYKDAISQYIENDRFEIFGQALKLSEVNSWHKDYLSGYEWNQAAYFKDIKIRHNEGDIKFPWELSRCHHLMLLVQDYTLNKNDTSAKLCIDHMIDWIEKNPAEEGVNWACPMDVGIRACNWIFCLNFLWNNPRFSDDKKTMIVQSIAQHGRHIIENLEYNEILTSNHYLANLAGLAFIANTFTNIPNAGKWHNFTLSELTKEMEKQVNKDGTDFEASTCYHRLALELFFYSTLIFVKSHPKFNGKNYRSVAENIFGISYVDSLYRMFEAVLYLLKPNGTLPQIGDNDSGQLFKLGFGESLDGRYLMTLAAIFFNDRRFKIKEFGFCEETLWIFGSEGREIWGQLPENTIAEIKSHSFSDSGWFVMRDNRNYILVSCGPNGQNDRGGHGHNDKLSFELCINGEDVIVDPGTGVYTPNTAVRNRFRSTLNHNTVSVDGQEQNQIPKDLWSMSNDARAQVLKWDCQTDTQIFIGQHHGFGPGIIHQREVIYHLSPNSYLEIIDRFEGEGEHKIFWNLICAPNHRHSLKVESDSIPWQKGKGEYSPSYGTIIETQKYHATLTSEFPCEFRFVINGE